MAPCSASTAPSRWVGACSNASGGGAAGCSRLWAASTCAGDAVAFSPPWLEAPWPPSRLHNQASRSRFRAKPHSAEKPSQ